ncbi:MAG: hypothetical protein SCH39_04610 [Methanosarcinales archaeon]|nr:hypothetical protein [ANME-2 cluster archaeon]MDW7775607.1 hypothetical protein [Methanosarcinales archaeon]
MKLKYIFFTLLTIMIYYPILRLGHGIVEFQDNVMVNQFMAHKGLHEIYVHIYSGFLLFLVSVISVILLYDHFKDSKYTWKPVMAGILSTGLIGLGEGAEHLFATFGHEVFHYTHMIGSPVAMYFLYIGTKEYSMQFKEGGKPMATRSIIAIMSSVFIVSVILASFAREEWDPYIERPFILIIAIPLILLSVLTIKEAYNQFEMQKMVMHNLSLLALSVMLLNIVILLGRDADIARNAYIYLVAQVLQVIFLIVTATFIMVFTISMYIIMKQDDKKYRLPDFGKSHANS